MTLEQKLQHLLGMQIFQLAVAQTQIEQLTEKVAKLEAHLNGAPLTEVNNESKNTAAD